MSNRKKSKTRQKSLSSSGEKILENILINEDENKRLVGELRLNFGAQRRKGVKLRVNVVERQKCISKIRTNRRDICQTLSNIKDAVRSKSPEKFATPTTTTPTVPLDKNLVDRLEKARRDLESVEQEIEPWLHICKEAEEDFVNKNQESILLYETNKRVGQVRRDLVDDLAIFLANLPEELKRSVSGRDAIAKAVCDAVSASVEFFDDCSKLSQDCKSLENLATDFDHNLKQLLDENERSSQFLDSMKNCDSNKYFYGIENAVADNYCHSTPAVPFLGAQESLTSSLEKLYDWCRLELSKPSRFVEQISSSSRQEQLSRSKKMPSSSAASTPSSPTIDWSIEKAWLVDMRFPVNDQLATIEKQLESATVENKELLQKLAKIENEAKKKPPSIVIHTKRTTCQKLKTQIRALDKDSSQISTILPILRRKITEKTEFLEAIDDKINITRLKSRKYDEKYTIDRKSTENELESIDRKKQFLMENIKDIKDNAADLTILKIEVEILNKKIVASRAIIDNFDQRLFNINAFIEVVTQNRITYDSAEDVGPFSSRKTTGQQRVQNKDKETKNQEESSR